MRSFPEPQEVLLNPEAWELLHILKSAGKHCTPFDFKFTEEENAGMVAQMELTGVLDNAYLMRLL